jgi:chromatin remodeling complex protein RSC6
MPSKPLYVLFYAILKIKLFEEEKNMMEKGLKKPVKLKADLAAFCGVGTLPRLEITKKLWDHIKAKKLQAKTANGKPEGSGKSSGKVTNFTGLKVGQTIDMMQLASVVSANIE